MSFFSEDPFTQSERNSLKITSSYSTVERERKGLLVIQVNVPSSYLRNGLILERIPQLIHAMRLQSGLELGRDRPLVSVEATFILRSKRHPDLTRVFVGSIQRDYRSMNQICPPEPIQSAVQLKELIRVNIEPDHLAGQLDSSRLFPDSDWVFESVVSIVLNLNARVKLPPHLRRFRKTFPDWGD